MADSHTVDPAVGRLADVVAFPLSSAMFLRDLVALTKPRITAMALIVAAGAMLLAPGHIAIADALWSLFAIGAAVAGAGALNMLIERDVDALMERTADRPLVARRLAPVWAVVVGVGLAGASLPIIAAHGSALACALTAFSLFVYVLVYTPMKRTSPWALVVGAVPGAMPALMGSSAVSGRFDAAGVALFSFVFLWQLPHFLAIAIYREREYAAAGHKVVPAVWGVASARILVIASALLLAATGVALVPLHVGGVVSLLAAVALGGWFVALSVAGLFSRDRKSDDVWAKKVFRASLAYQTGLFAALAIDNFVARL